MTYRTRGQIEDEFTKAMIQFEKDQHGRGPVEARTFFLDDMILVRLQGILTPAEQRLAETREGQVLIKEMRRQLFETSRSMLEAIVREVLGCDTISLHTDMSTKTGERIIVFVVDADLEERFR